MMRKNLSARLTLGADVLSKLCAGDSPSVHADHIIPKPLGDDTEANLQGCCAPCHSVKTRLIDPILRKGIGASNLENGSTCGPLRGTARVTAVEKI